MIDPQPDSAPPLRFLRRLGTLSGLLFGLILAAVAGLVLFEKFVARDVNILVQPKTERRFINLPEFPPNRTVTMQTTLYDCKTEACSEWTTRQVPNRMRTDANGFIQPSLLHDKPDWTVAFVGGSTTAMNWVLEEKRFPHLAGQVLERRLGKKINTVNAARSGNNTLHSIFIVLAKLYPLKPDFIVMMHAINDLSLLLRGGYRVENNRFFKIIYTQTEKAGLGSVAAEIERAYFPYTGAIVYWAYFNKIRPIIEKLCAHLGCLKGETRHEQYKLKVEPYERADILRQFRQHLNLWVHACRSQGIEPILMTQFNIIEVGRALSAFAQESYMLEMKWEDYVPLYKAFNQQIRDTAAELGVALVDLDREVPKRRVFFRDLVHVTTGGSEIAAEAIAKVLAGRFEARPAAAAAR